MLWQYTLYPLFVEAMYVWHEALALNTGGEEEAEAAYDEAFHAIFHLQLERHRHTQAYTSKKDGRSKWAMIEMSPITVSSCTTTPSAHTQTPHGNAAC